MNYMQYLAGRMRQGEWVNNAGKHDSCLAAAHQLAGRYCTYDYDSRDL